MLRGAVSEGDTVRFLHDKEAGKIRWEKRPSAEAAAAAGAQRPEAAP